jgi:hypothetical protein
LGGVNVSPKAQPGPDRRHIGRFYHGQGSRNDSLALVAVILDLPTARRGIIAFSIETNRIPFRRLQWAQGD